MLMHCPLRNGEQSINGEEDELLEYNATVERANSIRSNQNGKNREETHHESKFKAANQKTTTKKVVLNAPVSQLRGRGMQTERKKTKKNIVDPIVKIRVPKLVDLFHARKWRVALPKVETPSDARAASNPATVATFRLSLP